jgi:hypothetical protein
MPVVIKTCPKSNEFPGELQMLRHYAGCGAVPLLADDVSRYAMLLAYVAPGTTLHAGISDDDTATTIAAQLMYRSITPAPHDHTMPHRQRLGEGILTSFNRHSAERVRHFAPAMSLASKFFMNSGIVPFRMHYTVIYTTTISSNMAANGSSLTHTGSSVATKPLNAGHFYAIHMMYWHNHRDIVTLTQRRIAIMSEILAVPTSHIALWNFAQMGALGMVVLRRQWRCR